MLRLEGEAETQEMRAPAVDPGLPGGKADMTRPPTPWRGIGFFGFRRADWSRSKIRSIPAPQRRKTNFPARREATVSPKTRV